MAAAAELGVVGLRGCRRWTVYHLEGHLTSDDIARLCREVLVDPVTDHAVVGPPAAAPHVVEVAPVAGVTDPAARELERAAATLGLGPLRAATARRYELSGDLDDADVAVLTRRLLANPTIERSSRGELAPAFSPAASAGLAVVAVRLAGLSDDELADLSRGRLLSLDTGEMRAIQAHFASMGRDPTDAELETLAQTWSEHCAHKTFKAHIRLTHTRAGGQTEVSDHDGLLAALRRATDELDVAWLRSVFVDNAGIIAFDDRLDLAVKVETHNHPSALEPFGGANTGVGGVVRDILGVSARPIACTDVLCFGPADLDDDDLPDGVLHPRRIRDGVVAGIGDYGNKLGLPTVNGAVLYDRGYVANPLVFCGAVGLLPSGSHPTEPRPGDRIVVIGGRTGRDGIHGATFSSAGLDAAVAERAGSAVQIGDPITEKGCIEVVERARDLGLYNAITDCGAGGLSSAVGEMGADLGAVVDLAAAPLKYPGLQPWEIWVSEAQERMVLAVPTPNVQRLQRLCDEWSVEMSDIGSFSSDRRLVVRHGRLEVIDLPMSLLHDGLPRRRLVATHRDPAVSAGSPGALDGIDPVELLLGLLSHPNVCSRESIVRTYDHEVRGGTVVRPLVGPGADGPADAAVLKPLGTWAHDMAVSLAVGIVPRLTARRSLGHGSARHRRGLPQPGGRRRRPRPGGAARQFLLGRPRPSGPARIAGAGRPGLHRGLPALPGALRVRQGQPLQRVRGRRRAGHAADLGRRRGRGPEPGRHQRPQRAAGRDLWLVGRGSPRLGGSLAAEMLGIGDTRVPAPVDDPLSRYRAVHALIAGGHVSAAHDVSDGGVATALAEMAIAGGLGLRATIPCDADGEEAEASCGPVAALFNEAPGRLLLESPAEKRNTVATTLGGFGRRIGTVTGTGRIEIRAVGSSNGAAVGQAADAAIALEAARRAFGCDGAVGP